MSHQIYPVDPLRRSIHFSRDESGLGIWAFPLALETTKPECIKNACVKLYKWYKTKLIEMGLSKCVSVFHPFAFRLGLLLLHDRYTKDER